MTHHYTPGQLFVAELAAGGIAGHFSRALDALPGWVGGILGALVVALVMRLLGPTLDDTGQRIRTRLTGRHRALPAAPTPAPSDDPDPTG